MSDLAALIARAKTVTPQNLDRLAYVLASLVWLLTLVAVFTALFGAFTPWWRGPVVGFSVWAMVEFRK